MSKHKFSMKKSFLKKKNKEKEKTSRNISRFEKERNR